jgi:hypothetical protein
MEATPLSGPDAVLDDLAERVGRICTADMLAGTQSEHENFAIAGYLAVACVLDAVADHFDSDDFDAFVDRLRTSVARYEEQVA